MFWGDKTQLSVQEYLHWASSLHPNKGVFRDGKDKYMPWDGPELAQRPLGEEGRNDRNIFRTCGTGALINNN